MKLSLGIKIFNQPTQSSIQQAYNIPAAYIADNKPNDIFTFSADFIPETVRDFSLTEINIYSLWKNKGGDKAEILLVCHQESILSRK